ncbi:hypothetical protein PHMEG_00038124 [Phytophthora megakarya]|uniref:Uncharacterized protein n=1 Tax=Phytophthora megakarya TaxID=4795 RepID=A0A225UI11_9STRA|nr:hypothetical protein PHMEG_00038124 [Phytophthora megakarya]
MAARLAIVEAALLKRNDTQVTTGQQEEAQNLSEQESKLKRRKKHTTSLSAAWYKWYTKVPSVWESADRQKKSESHHIIAFMKLFLLEGFTLVHTADYKDQVLDTGRHAEDAAQGTNARAAGSVLRALRPLHKSGALNGHITAYKLLLVIGQILGPAPADTQDILSVVRRQ